MSKKTRAKRKQNKGKHRTFGKYIKVYLTSLAIGSAVFILGTVIFKPQVPCANSHSCTSDLTVKIENGATGMFDGKKVIPPIIAQSQETSQQSVLGTQSAADKHIYVDLTTQTLYAYQGATLFMQTLVSTGRWNKTPVGNFNIWEKLISTRMSGGQGADAYDLPNVPYVMYFYSDYGLHGAYWHDNFGHTMSHGCVNMRQIDAKKLYNWADGPVNGQLGTAVSVCDNFIAPGTCVQNNPIN